VTEGGKQLVQASISLSLEVLEAHDIN